MITLNDYIEKLLELQKQGYGDLPVIYASDDEGNSYHKVGNLPCTYKVVDLKDYCLEPNFDNGDYFNEVNCIIVN